MSFWQELIDNQILISSVIAWTIAQILKTCIDFGFNKNFRPERLVGSGGMPSSHSSIVCALAASSALQCGLSSFEFAVSFVLAAVVMYDATGVRQETGKQAKLLNLIIEQDWFKLDNQEIQEKLKEFVGHTPLQVFVGAVLGILTALAVDMWY